MKRIVYGLIYLLALPLQAITTTETIHIDVGQEWKSPGFDFDPSNRYTWVAEYNKNLLQVTEQPSTGREPKIHFTVHARQSSTRPTLHLKKILIGSPQRPIRELDYYFMVR